MASLLFREAKGVNFSCASPASAAICTSIEPRSIVQPRTRSIDRHTLHLRDSHRANALTHLSQLPSNPKTYTQKSRKSTEKPPELISPAGSSRYLLNNTSSFDAFPVLEPAPALSPIESPRLQPLKKDESAVLRPSSSLSPRLQPLTRDESAVLRPSSSTRAQNQVVVLRVSLHCKGCEGKVRKHISKMEGVTSFNIDMATKKVTVVGDVTPLGVLNSVSKVKNACFWSSPPRSSASF